MHKNNNFIDDYINHAELKDKYNELKDKYNDLKDKYNNLLKKCEDRELLHYNNWKKANPDITRRFEKKASSFWNL
jgi:hypothetical protein